VLVLGLSACGSAADESASTDGTAAAASPPVIQIDGSQIGDTAGGRSAAPMAAEDAAASDSKMMPAQITYVYDGDLVDLTAPAAAWYFDPTATPTTEQIAALAQTLGVQGEVREQSADMGGGWIVGPDNYEQPTVNVGADAMQSWWYNPGSAAVDAPACELYPPGDPAGDFGDAPDAAPAGDVATDATDMATEPAIEPAEMPVCQAPEPPANVPDTAAAEGKARQLFATLGFDDGTFEFEAFADEWSANVTGYLVLDGMRTSTTINIGFGAEGALTWASGFLATPQRGADYPRIGIEAAVQRLNDQSATWMGLDTPVMREATDSAGAGAVGTEAPNVATEPAVGAPEAEAPADDAVAPMPGSVPDPMVDPIDGVCLDNAASECAPAEPITVEPITVTLTNARPSLEQLWASDDTVWLLPGYAFDAADGGLYSVMAVEDQYIEVAQATEVPTPDTIAPVDPDAATPPADCPERPTEITEPGLSESIAGTIVGLCEADAEAMVTEMYPDATMRVVRIDGVDLAVTADFSETRVNVAVDKGIVTDVVSLG
jgi:hypothetical protein